MPKKFFVLIVMLFLTQCTTDTDKTAVSFMVFGDPAERQAYQTLVNAFEETNPTIDIRMTHIPSPREYRTRLATEYAAGTPPDVSLMNYRRYAAFAAKELLEPLTPYLTESALIQADDFFPIAIESFTWRKEIMCIPQNISSLVVYYNQDLFEANGIPYPSDKWTWAEFLQTAIDLTQDTNNDGRLDQYGLGIEPSLFRLAPFVWQNNGPIVDSDQLPTSLTLTRPI